MIHDLVVVGGGPVGLVTALEARRAGLRVAVVEPRTTPIDKPCGEGIMPAGVQRLAELGIEPVGAPLTGITYVAAGARATAHFRGHRGLGVRRTDLHTAIHRAAVGAGVVMIRDTVLDVAPAARPLDITLRSGPALRATWVVGADGLHSRLRRLVAQRVLAPKRLRRFGFVTHVPRPAGTSNVTVHWCERGEAYVTPLAGSHTAIAVLTRAGTRPGEVLAALPELADLADGVRPERMRGAGAFLQLPARRARGQVLLVGDAAGYVDALTGEGLSLGFAQARAAVEAIAGGGAPAYERAWWRISAAPLGMAGALVAATSSARFRAAIVPAATRLPDMFERGVLAASGSG